MTLMIGIDPGLHKMGVGLIELVNNRPKYITHTVIITKPTQNLEHRLNVLFESLSSFLSIHKPSVMIIEEIFASINRNTIIKLGMARSIAVLCASRYNCELINVPTRVIKKKITGLGSSEKDVVAKYVCAILNIDIHNNFDATDALACALYNCI